VSTVCVDDADLVERARAGDAAAFGALVDRHHSAVFRAALAALGSHADAEDAAQDAFFVAYRRLDSFRGEASFKTWLLTIAWHQAINRRRMLARLWRHLTGSSNGDAADVCLDDIAGPGPTPETIAADEQLRISVCRAIRRLSPKLRDALLLAQSEEHSYEEISVMLGAPPGTIKWRISEARKILRKHLISNGHMAAK
jgi:RNA polymerase sigma-70 factor (ECF subfamily)